MQTDRQSLKAGKNTGRLWTVLLFSLGASLAFLGKPVHMDEPVFLAIAANIARQPLHPLSFTYNWNGFDAPRSQTFDNPLGFPYLLAAAYKATGGAPAALRLLFIPFDLAAAAALYLLAARFLARPLGPTLIALAGPAYLLNMSQLTPERVVAPLAFAGLYALVRGADEADPRWQSASAALLGAALLMKYSALFLFFPALGYSLHKRVPPRRIAAFLLIAAAPILAYFAADLLRGRATAGAVWDAYVPSARAWWSRWPHKSRALLSFCGGAGAVTAFWPYLALQKKELPALAASAAAALFIFLEAWDPGPVRALDRVTGVVFSVGGGLGLLRGFLGSGRRAGWALWAPWTLGVLGALAAYHSIVSRLVAFLIPPVVFSLAEAFEARVPHARLRRLYAASFLATLSLSAAAAAVDRRFATAQKEAAEAVSRDYIAKGRKVWFVGHWGLQYYLEQAGALPLDRLRGGWDVVKPGEAVVSPMVNGDIFGPGKPLLADVRIIQVDSPIPLRLMSAWGGQGGFFSSVWGFLPFCFSREPIDEIRIVERR